MSPDWIPFWLGLRVSAIAVGVGFVLGVPLAWALAGYSFRGKRIVEGALTLLLLFPAAVLAYYLLVLLGRNGMAGRLFEHIFGAPLLFTWQGAAFAASFHSMPLLAHHARRALGELDRDYFRAARSLGAREWRTFISVALPLTWRPVLRGVLLAFCRTLIDFGLTMAIVLAFPGQAALLGGALQQVAEGTGTMPGNLLIGFPAVAVLLVWLAHLLEDAQARLTLAQGIR